MKTKSVAWLPGRVTRAGLDYARSSFWQSLSYDLGDEFADSVCEWVDQYVDAEHLVDALTTALELGRGQAVIELMRESDVSNQPLLTSLNQVRPLTPFERAEKAYEANTMRLKGPILMSKSHSA